MAYVNVIKLSSYVYQMKVYSFSFEVVQTIFQYNEECSSYDVLNKNIHSKRTKRKYLIVYLLEAMQAI